MLLLSSSAWARQCSRLSRSLQPRLRLYCRVAASRARPAAGTRLTRLVASRSLDSSMHSVLQPQAAPPFGVASFWGWVMGLPPKGVRCGVPTGEARADPQGRRGADCPRHLQGAQAPITPPPPLPPPPFHGVENALGLKLPAAVPAIVSSLIWNTAADLGVCAHITQSQILRHGVLQLFGTVYRTAATIRMGCGAASCCASCHPGVLDASPLCSLRIYDTKRKPHAGSRANCCCQKQCFLYWDIE